MSRFPFEQPNLRLYKYYFLGLPEPITISAYNKKEARAAIDRIWRQLPPVYQASKIIGETVTLPVFGVTERKQGERTVVWVGKEYSQTGWMDREQYKKRFET
jgi:predicted GTPase